MTTLAQRASFAEATAAGALVQWIARTKALAPIGPLHEGAASLGAPPGIVEAMKAAVPAGSITASPQLGGTSSALAAFVNATAEQSVLLRLIGEDALLRMPLDTRLLALGADASAAVVGEGQPIPLQAFQWDAQTLGSFKIAALVAFSDELWRDISSAGQAFVNAKLREAVGQVADRQFFERILTSGSPSITSSATTTPLMQSLREMLDAVHTRPGARLHWAVSPTAANILATLAEDRPQLNPFAGQMLNLPATITSGLTGRQVVLIDGRGIAGNVVGLRVDVSREATMQFLDNPTNTVTTPTATTMVSLFQVGASAVRVILELGVMPFRDVTAALLTIEEAP